MPMRPELEVSGVTSSIGGVDFYGRILFDYPVFLCERHTRLTGNIDFQNNLLHALLSVDR